MKIILLALCELSVQIALGMFIVSSQFKNMSAAFLGRWTETSGNIPARRLEQATGLSFVTGFLLP